MRLRRRGFSLFGLLAALPLRSSAEPPSAETTAAVISAAAYELFPHEQIDAQHYAGLAAAFISADVDRALGLAAVLGGTEFVAVSRDERLARMTAAQGEAAFQALRMHMLMGLYNDLSVTRKFGYQGSSFAQGGYLRRGFDDVQWLPDSRSDAH